MNTRFKKLNILLIFALILQISFPQMVFAEENAAEESTTHYLVFASDRHSNTSAISESTSGFNPDAEYVALIGDMVNHTDEFDVSTIYNEVKAIFENATVDIMWGTHDKNYTDSENLDIMNCVEENSSGVVFEGPDSDLDDNPDYYVYGVAFKDMQSIDNATTQSQIFKEWVDTIDKKIPIIVICHMPLHAKRDDNLGGYTWGKALNYAATGSEDDESLSVTRDVIYFYGHNHTVEKEEYYYPVNSLVQLENCQGKNSGMGEPPANSPSGDTGEHKAPPEKPASQDEDNDGIVEQPEGVEEPYLTLKFTYLAAGYLNADTHATQMTITDNEISFNRSGDELGTITRVNDVYEINSELEDSTINLKAEDSITLTPITTPSNATITWNSDDSLVVSVDKDGTLTTVGNGSANVTASIRYILNGNLETKTIIYKVNVSGYKKEEYVIPNTGISDTNNFIYESVYTLGLYFIVKVFRRIEY